MTAQGPPPDPRFGAVEAFRDPVAAAEAGVGWERILFYWSELQPNGPDDWNGYHVPEEWLTQAAAAGREVMVALKHTPAWATDGPPGCGVPRGLDLPVDDPGNLWAAFVRRTVQMYAGRIDHWIIWNEPDIAPDEYGVEWCGSVEEYYQLLKVAYLAAHQVNPNSVIHLAGLTYFHDIIFGRPYYLSRFLDVAAQDPTGPEHGYYFDVISLHIYFEIRNFATVFNDTRAALATHGLQKPIWVNETNAPPNTDPLWPMEAANYYVSLEEQASFLLQSFALALNEGAERVAVYKWLDNDLPPGFEPFGVIRPDYSRRPAFDAYRLITMHYASTISARKNQYALYEMVTLERGNLTTRVLWASTASAATVSLPALAPQARLIDQTGAEQLIEPVNGQYMFTLPRARCADKRGCIIGGPTYLLVEDTGTPLPPATATLTPTVPPSETPEPMPTETPTTTPTEIPSPTPTEAPTYAPTPIEIPTSASIPTPTEAPIPTSIEAPTPLPPTPPPPTITPALPTSTSTAQSPSTAIPSLTIWLLLGMVVVVILAAIIGTLFSYRGG